MTKVGSVSVDKAGSTFKPENNTTSRFMFTSKFRELLSFPQILNLKESLIRVLTCGGPLTTTSTSVKRSSKRQSTSSIMLFKSILCRRMPQISCQLRKKRSLIALTTFSRNQLALLILRTSKTRSPVTSVKFPNTLLLKRFRLNSSLE